MRTERVQVTGPDAANVVGRAVALACAVRSGAWGAVVWIRPDAYRDPDRAAARFDALAAEWPQAVGVAGLDRGEVMAVRLDGQDEVTVEARYGVLTGAVDLAARVLVGQVGEVAGWVGAARDACQRLRRAEQSAGGFPDGAFASWAISGAGAPVEAKVLYEVWKGLGGGVSGRGGLGLGVRVERVGTHSVAR